MPERYTKRERKIIYDFLVRRDGERCDLCGQSPPEALLEVDHTDGNYRNHQPENLRLLCRSCNRADGNRRRNRASFRLSKSVCAREGSPTLQARERLDYQQGSVEMQASDLYETQFIRWILEELERHSRVSWQEAIHSGAHLAGCSPMSTERYLKKLVSREGPLARVRDQDRQWVVKWKQR